MNLTSYRQIMLPAVDAEIRQVLATPALDPCMDLREILLYHLGYEGDQAVVEAQGKRIRPLLVMLTAEAVGGDWRTTLPAAAAVELLHNFSLIHDDIEDRSDTRRGRATVWAKWKEAVAINAGDAMNALAYVALEGLSQTIDWQAALEVYRILAETCLRLTGGQHLDISSEEAGMLPLEVYWAMIGGKTAALISASVRLGAVIAGANPEMIRILETFGYSLGLAFQVQDDWLGIWGDPAKTGKSSLTDLIARKKTLPVIFGLQQRGRFYQAWNNQTENRGDLEQLAALLEEEGAKAFTAAESARLMEDALRALNAVGLENEGGKALRVLATGLQARNF